MRSARRTSSRSAARVPPGRVAKGQAIAGRARALERYARATTARPRALARVLRPDRRRASARACPSVTMMDYEFQPANHLSFRLATTVIVPEVFPADALRRQGGRARQGRPLSRASRRRSTSAGARPTPRVLAQLGLDPAKIIVSCAPPPEGALYHRSGNDEFERVVTEALAARRSRGGRPAAREKAQSAHYAASRA